jgi:hypothetical protein
MRFAARSTATTLAVDLPARPDATPTFTVVGPAGGVTQAAGDVTLDGADTTLAAPAVAGATLVTLTSATGVTAGRRYLVAGPEGTGGEAVTVRSVSGAAVRLVRPLRADRASGVAFQSARVTCAVEVAAVPSYGRHYRLAIAWALAAVEQPVVDVPFDVCRYVPLSHLTVDHVGDMDPAVIKRLPAGLWPPALIDRAWEILCRRIAAKKAPGALIGSIDLTVAHGYLFRALLLETAGDGFDDDRARMMARFGEELEATLASAAFDDDMDGEPEPHEQWFRSIDVIRG